MSSITIPTTFFGRVKLAGSLLCKNIGSYLALALLTNIPYAVMAGLMFMGLKTLTEQPLLISTLASLKEQPLLLLTLVLPIVLIVSIVMVVACGAFLQMTEAILEKKPTSSITALRAGVKNFWFYSRVLLRTMWYMLWPIMAMVCAGLIIIATTNAILTALDQQSILTIANIILGGLIVIGYVGLLLWRLPATIFSLPLAAHSKLTSANEILAKTIQLIDGKWWAVFGNVLGIYAVIAIPTAGIQAVVKDLTVIDHEAFRIGIEVGIPSILGLISAPFFYLLLCITFLHLKQVK